MVALSSVVIGLLTAGLMSIGIPTSIQGMHEAADMLARRERSADGRRGPRGHRRGDPRRRGPGAGRVRALVAGASDLRGGVLTLRRAPLPPPPRQITAWRPQPSRRAGTTGRRRS